MLRRIPVLFKNPTAAGAVGLAIEFIPGEKIAGGIVKMAAVVKRVARTPLLAKIQRDLINRAVAGGTEGLIRVLIRIPEYSAGYRKVFQDNFRWFAGYKDHMLHHLIPKRFRKYFGPDVVDVLDNLYPVPKKFHEAECQTNAIAAHIRWMEKHGMGVEEIQSAIYNWAMELREKIIRQLPKEDPRRLMP